MVFDAPSAAAIRDGLQPLSIEGLATVPANGSATQHPAETPAVPVHALLQSYVEFYSLDFTGTFPDLRHRFGQVSSRNDQLAVQVFTLPQARGNLLLVHGYLDHAGIYGHMIRYGLERQLNVVVFDLPGHGLSTGARVAIDDFSGYSQAVADVMNACASLAGSWQLLAQSMGGAITLDYLLRRDSGQFDRVVLLAPLLRPRGWKRARLGWRLLHRFRSEVEREFVENSHDQEFLAFVSRDPLQYPVISVPWVGALRRWLASLPETTSINTPILLIQGKEDGTVDWGYNVKRYLQLLPGLQVKYIEEGRHQLVNESEAIRGQLTSLADEFFELSVV